MPGASRDAWLAARVVILAVAIGMPSIARAVNYTWDASGGAPLNDGSGTWSSSGGTNWLNANTSTYGAWGNTTSDVAFFGVGNGAAGTINVNGAVATNGITFNSAGSGNYTLTGGTISIGGSSPTIAVNAAGTSTIASALTASSGFTKTGAGDLVTSGVITGASTFNNNGTGTWEISGGFNRTSPMTLQTNAGMGNILVSGTIGGSNNSLNLIGTGTGTISGNTTNAYALQKNGSGLWILTGSNAYGNGLTVNAGILQVGSGGTTGAISTLSTISGSSGATLAFNRSDTIISGSHFAAAIGGSINVTQMGSGTLVLNGANTYTGTTSINNGTLQIGNGSTSGALSASSLITGSSGATLAFNRSDSYGGNVSNTIGGDLGVRVSAGTLTLAGNNSYTGGTVLSGGILSLGSANAIGSAGTISFAGGTMQFTASNTTDYSSRFSTAGSQAFNIDTNGQAVTLATGLAGSGNTLRKLGTGTLALTGSNSLTTETAINAGVLSLGSADALGSAGTISFGGGTMQFTAANTTDYLSRFSTAAGQNYEIDTNGQNVAFAASFTGTGSSLRKSGAGTLTLSGTSRFGSFRAGGGMLVNTGSISTAASAPSIQSGTFNNQGVVNTLGTGFTVGGSGTLLNSGTVVQGSYSDGYVTGNASIVNSGRIAYGGWWAGVGNVPTYELASFTNNVGGNLSTGDTSWGNQNFASFTNAGGTYTVGSGLSIGRSNGSIASGTTSFTVNSGTVTAGSSGVISLSISGTVSNATAELNLNGGLFSAGRGITTSLGSGTNNALVVNFGGGTLAGTGASATLLPSSLTAVNLNAGGGTIDIGSSVTNTIAAGMGGVGGLTKSGAGTLILSSSSNTYAGNSTVAAGTLQIGNGSTLAGSLPGNVTLSNNGTLAFNATVDQTYAGVISGTGLMTKSGAGSVLTLSGNGSVVNGGITVSSGALLNTGSVSTGSAANTGNVAVNSGTYTNQGQHSFVGSLTVASGAVFVNSGTTTMPTNSFLQLDGTSSGQNTGSMTVAFLRLNGSSVTGPATFVNGTNGVMTINEFILGNGGFGSFTNNGGRLTVNSGQFTIGKAGGTATGTSSLTVNSGTVTNNNNGSTVFRLGDYGNGSNTTAEINLNGGLFETAGSLAMVTSSGTNNAARINFNGGTLRGLTNGATLLASNLTGVSFAAGGGTIDLASGITSTAAANFSGVGGFTKSGSGTLILTGSSNTNAGPNAVTGGILQIGDGSSAAGSLSGNIVLSNTTTLAFNSTATQAYAGVISGTGLMTKSGAGSVLTLSGNGSVVNGGITINSGAILNTGSLSTGSGANAGNVAVNSGTYTNQGQHSFVGSLTVASGASVVNSGTMTMGAGSFFTISGAGSGQNTGTMNVNFFRLNGVTSGSLTTFTNGANGSMTIDSFIIGETGYSSFTNDGGRLTIPATGGQFTIGKSGGTETGTSTLTVNSGTVTNNNNSSFRLGNYSNGSNTTAEINLNGGLFETVGSLAMVASSGTNNAARINFNGGTLRGLTNNATLLASSVGVTLAAGGGTIDLAAGITGTAAADMSGAGGLTKTGAGTLVLTGSNGFTGATAINAGVLNVGSANALAGGGTMSFGGGTLQYSAANTNDFSGRFSTAASQAYRIDTNGQNVSFANPLVSTNGSLVKTGGGTLTLANSSTTASSLGLLRADGGVLTLASGRVDVSGTNSQMFATNGGSLTVTGGTMNAGSVFWQPIIGQGSTGSLTVSGGRFISGTVGGMMIGNGAAGTVTVSGSGVFESASPVAFLIGRDGGTGVLNLNGGTIETSGTLQGSDFNGATGTLNLAGGTLKSRNASNANWISSGVGTLNVRVGGSDAVANSGAVFDTNGYTMGIGLNLTTSATGSAIDGGLVLNDTAATKGTLMLSGSNSYNGLTRLIAGTLDFNSINALRNSSGVSIAGGAGLRYSGGAASFDRNITVTSGTGTVANSGGGLLTLAGTLTKNGTILRLTGGQFNVTGQIVGSSSNSDLVVDGTSTVTLSSANTYNGPTFVNQASNLIVNINNAIPSGSIITLGDATTSGTLSLGSFSDAIGGLSFGAGGGTLRMAAASTSSAPLTASAGTVNLNNGTLDLTGSGTSAGLYRLISAQTVAGTLSSVTGASAAYQVVTTSSSVNYQQRAVLGAVSVTNPAAAIITGGSAAFTYTVANNALSGGADLAFSSGSPSNIAGTSSGTAAAGGSSSSVSGLVFTGTSVGAGRNGTFAVNALSAYGSTTASGTVSVDVYNHASGSATGATIALADSIVGYTGSLVGLTSATISNAAGYRVNLMTTGGTSAGFVNINNVSGVAAGSSGQISAAAGLDGSQTVGANSLGQTFNLTYADDSNLNGASNNLGSQAITVTGRVLDHATSSLGASLLTSTTVSLGTYNYSTNTWESGGATGFFDIYNLASAFGASLTADLSLVNAIGAGNGFTTNLLSTYADIAGNGSQRFSIFFDPSGAQANRSTTFTISMSDKTGMAGATASNTLFVTANVIVVPEPGSIALAGLGIGLAGWMALRRRKSP